MSEQKSIQKFDNNTSSSSSSAAAASASTSNNHKTNNNPKDGVSGCTCGEKSNSNSKSSLWQSSKQQQQQQKGSGSGVVGSKVEQQPRALGSNLSMEGISIEDYSKYLTSRTSVHVKETESFQDWQKRAVDDREKIIKDLVTEQLQETERRAQMLQKECPACRNNAQQNHPVNHNNCSKIPNESSESIAAVCNRIRERKMAKSKRI